ncbi:hypothetical protein F53441_12484 [Fusarium austroafricanum]|uniref:Ubiquitin-like domain-containing protein n=1 Tax=Fusarium austroafricanum TaxID=2364996 RepID=A0A8H4NJ06_9HYPO|nr:hypothetical protein F53441_12484 [Fusarium austroafricanum]
MLEELVQWAPTARVSQDKIELEDLVITFKRTVRVPDNDESNHLPPDMGSFPLFKIDDYAGKLPVKMAQKGGLFLPMYQREALWIYFESSHRYAIKIFVGGINAISGEPAVPTRESSVRRQNLVKEGKSLQDYIFVPGQRWLDGIAVEPGHVRQFVAMPVGTGHSVEFQMTGEEKAAGIQFEITKLVPLVKSIGSGSGEKLTITITAPCGRTIRVTARTGTRGWALKEALEQNGISTFEATLYYADGPTRVGDYSTLGACGISDGDTLELLPLLIGGGGPRTLAPDIVEMSIAGGGRISQEIVAVPKQKYQKSIPATFNVQILNSASFERVTSQKPPKSPVTAKTYADCGYPFFALYEEPSNISGNFEGLRSVAQMDKTSDKSLPNIPVIDIEDREVWVCSACGQANKPADQKCGDCLEQRPEPVKLGQVGILNPRGTKTPLQLVWEMAEEASNKISAF